MVLRLSLCLFLLTATAYAQPPVYWGAPGIPPPDVTIALSVDEQTLAIARSSGGSAKRYARVELWNMKSGELQRTITGFDGPIWSISFSKDGRSLMTVSTQYRDEKIQSSARKHNETVTAELKWWDTESGEFVKRVPLGEEGITSIEASWTPARDVMALVERYSRRQLAPVDDSTVGVGPRRIVSGWIPVEDRYLRLLDAQSGERKVKVESGDQTYQGQLAWLARMGPSVFSRDGKLLAAVSGGDVNVWNVDSGKKLRTMGKLNGVPRAIAFSPDARLLAIAGVTARWPGADTEITVRDVSTGKEVNRLKGRNDSVASLRFIAEGRALLIGSLQYNAEQAMGTVKIWDLRENRLGKFDVHEGKAVSTLIHLPDQHTVILQSDTIVELRDVRSWNVIHTFEPTEDESETTRRSRFLLSASRAEAVGFSSDGLTISAQLPGEGIRVWDSRTGGVRNRIPQEQTSDDVTAMSSNGDVIVEAAAKEVRLLDLASGARKVLPLRISNRVSALALSRDGRSLVTGDDVGDIRLWDVRTGQLKKTFDTGQEITAVAIDPSGQWLAAARADHSIGLWNVSTGALQVDFKKHSDVVNALAFSPDGKTLASGGDDRTAILWDVASAQAKRTLKGHDFTVTSLAFSNDGLLLASASGNASVVLWDVATGKIERILR